MYGHQWLNAGASSQVFDGSKAQQKSAVEGGAGYTNDYSIAQEWVFYLKILK